MIILGLDTSGPIAGVAIAYNGEIRYEAVVKNRKTHSVNLMPMIEDAFQRSGLTKEDIQLIAVTVGPGSFTGVRLGVEAARALGHALKIPCIAVDALEATAWNVKGYPGIICPIQDARGGQVYSAAFNGDDISRVLDDAPRRIDQLLEELDSQTDRILFLGDGAVSYHEQIVQFPYKHASVFVPENHLLYLRPASVCAVAARTQDKAAPWQEIKPLYLRPPQAERQKNLVERIQ